MIGEDGVPLARRASASTAAAASAAGRAGAPAVDRVRATPLVRRVAAELGVDLGVGHGHGPAGRITEDDVRKRRLRRPPAAGRGRAARAAAGRAQADRRAPRTSHREVPAVTVVEECDFTALDGVRGERSYLPYLIAATVHGLRRVPELNARLDGDEIVYFERFDLGVAVQTEQGLVVPVVREVDKLSLDDIEAESTRLAEAAREGTLKPEELRGSTFTVSSGGKFGGLFATPLVNYPEVGILGLHRIAERPVVRDGEIVAAKVGWLSCTFDHRVVRRRRARARSCSK